MVKKVKTKKRKYERKAPLAQPKFYILWSPQSDKPPRKRFTLAKAEEVADIMVKKYGTQFYVMESVALHQMGKPERIPYTGPEPKEGKQLDDDRLRRPGVSDPFFYAASQTGGEPVNAFKSWDDFQDRKLRKLYHAGGTISQIAVVMGRSVLSIEYRLSHLGLRYSPLDDNGWG